MERNATEQLTTYYSLAHFGHIFQKTFCNHSIVGIDMINGEMGSYKEIQSNICSEISANLSVAIV